MKDPSKMTQEKLCVVCGTDLRSREHIIAKVHEGRLPGTPNRWRTIGVVCDRNKCLNDLRDRDTYYSKLKDPTNDT